MKTKSTRRRRTSRPVPLGLRALFEAMQNQGFRSFYRSTTPEAFLDIPRALQAVDQWCKLCPLAAHS